jgi:hypothetical protein
VYLVAGNHEFATFSVIYFSCSACIASHAEKYSCCCIAAPLLDTICKGVAAVIKEFGSFNMYVCHKLAPIPISVPGTPNIVNLPNIVKHFLPILVNLLNLVKVISMIFLLYLVKKVKKKVKIMQILKKI